MSILRKLFGPSRDEVWQQLSAELGGRFTDGGLCHPTKVQARAGEWTITLDTFVVSTGKTFVVFTRMRAPYVNKDGFRFKLYREGFVSDVGKVFGMQDIEIGNPEFDAAFILKGNNETQLQALFRNAEVRRRLLADPRPLLQVKDDEGWFGPTFPTGVDELYFQTGGVVKDLGRLKNLYDLFADVLHQLCHIGSAYEDDPKLKL